MADLLQGAIAAFLLVIGLFFLRFWHRTRDRFFLYFAGSFGLEAADRVALVVIPHANEQEPAFYVVRLLAYALIVLAIWQKNRAPK